MSTKAGPRTVFTDRECRAPQLLILIPLPFFFILYLVSFIFLSFSKDHTQTYQFSLYEETHPKLQDL